MPQNRLMEHVVGLIVRDEDGQDHCLLTWGRLYDAEVEYDALVTTVGRHLSGFGIRPAAGEKLRVALTLQEVAHGPYFHECLFDMSQVWFRAMLDPKLRDADEWARHRRDRMEQGRDIWYLGDPGRMERLRAAKD
jgi:hypothetical protein